MIVKITDLKHSHILALDTIMLYRLQLLSLPKHDAIQKMHLAIAQRLYDGKIHKKAKNPTPPKRTSLKLAYDEAYELFWAMTIFEQHQHSYQYIYERNVIIMLKAQMLKQMI